MSGSARRPWRCTWSGGWCSARWMSSCRALRLPVDAERARLFVALELPEAAREALERWRASVFRDVDGLRPVAPEALHATLCFLGWRSVDEIEQIVDRLRGSPTYRAELEGRRPRELAPARGSMERFLEFVDQQFGGSAGWLAANGLEPGDLERLRSRLRR